MKKYTFDVGHQDVIIEATSEEEAWEIVQQFVPENQTQVRLIYIQKY